MQCSSKPFKKALLHSESNRNCYMYMKKCSFILKKWGWNSLCVISVRLAPEIFFWPYMFWHCQHATWCHSWYPPDAACNICISFRRQDKLTPCYPASSPVFQAQRLSASQQEECKTCSSAALQSLRGGLLQSLHQHLKINVNCYREKLPLCKVII